VEKFEMINDRKFSIVTAVNDIETLRNNLYLSPEIKDNSFNQLIVKRGYSSAALAYNEAIEEAYNDVLIFVHQDVFFPQNWFLRLSNALNYLEKEQVNWGVIGCFGSRKESWNGVGRVFTTGMGLHGNEISKPEPVETVDEIVIIIRKSSGLRFDPSLPHFHLYGTDICMSARERGMGSYVVPAFCIHNTNQILKLPREFFECYKHIKRKYQRYLPIHTSCIKISKYDGEIYRRKIEEFIKKAIGKIELGEKRSEDPRILFDVLRKSGQISL
jgi:hypothetical protein